MATVVLLALTGLGLAGLYFLISSGLSLVFGLAGVLNFAHGLFLSAGAYVCWWAAESVSLPLAVLLGVAAAAAVGALVELVLIRPLYARPTDQVLVTVGLSLAGVALLQSVWGVDPRPFPRPSWTSRVIGVLGASVPADRFLLIGVAVAVLVILLAVLRFTRFGLIIRAGVENRDMVGALGINVRTAFTLVFAMGGALAGLAGVLGGMYFGSVSPGQGASLLIFAFIVVVIGGLGSVTGSAVAAVAVALVQQFVNYYGAAGAGDVSVVALLAVVLLLRPSSSAKAVTSS
jgi:branched-chain amino acid transport system permease protein